MRNKILALFLWFLMVLPLITTAGANDQSYAYVVQAGDEYTYEVEQFYMNGKNETTDIYKWADGTEGNVTLRSGTKITNIVCSVSSDASLIQTKMRINGNTTNCLDFHGDYLSPVYSNKSIYQEMADNSTSYDLQGNILTQTTNYTHSVNGLPVRFYSIVSRDISTGWVTNNFRKEINSTGGLIYLYEFSSIANSQSQTSTNLDGLTVIPFLIIITSAIFLKRKK